MIIDLDGVIRYMNPAASDILNRSDDELTGQKMSAIFLDDERNDPFKQTILDAISDSSSLHYNLIEYYTKNTPKTIYTMTSFLHDSKKKIALIVILNDMTNLTAMRKHYTDQLVELMDSLVRALSVAIEERSHYNARHTQNMVKMAERFISWLDETNDPWRFEENKKHAFLMSVWIHDVGKLSVPLAVMDKATKLGTFLEKIEYRFSRIHLLEYISMLEGRISKEEYQTLEDSRSKWLEFINRINTSGFLTEEDTQKIHELSAMRYREEDGTDNPYLTPEEINCLLIKKGMLTNEERAVMQNHVTVTKKILDRVSFPEAYAMVPDWAGSHHELKNGKGYPEHKSGDDIPKEVCLLTILDIFEALTAKDRPYKKPIPIDKAWDILKSMADEGSLDKDMLDLFEKSNAWKS